MNHTPRAVLAALALGTLAGIAAPALAAGGTTVFAGNLGDPGNGALVGSDFSSPANGAPDFSDPGDNVALYIFTVNYAGPVSVTSTAANAAGMLPYFTLFSGSGNSATFLASNFDFEAYDPVGGDFTWSGTLAAGTYEIALGTYENMSYAEQDPDHTTLGAGFIGFGQYLGTGDYSLTLTTPVPEPTSAWLLGLGLAALGTRSWRARCDA